MKNAYIISNTEMSSILKAHLSKQGYDTSKLTVRFTSTNAVVAGIEKVAEPGAGLSLATSSKFEDIDEYNRDALLEAVRGEITTKAMTLSALATVLAVSLSDVTDAVSLLNAEPVAPAREDGRTVSKWMLTGTEQYDAFVAKEQARIDEEVERWSDEILSFAPKYYEDSEDRGALVDRICENTPQSRLEALGADREDLRRDARSIFYRMAETDRLEHHNHLWRAAKTEADRTNILSLQGAVREILMADDHLGMSYRGLSEKLPGFVDDRVLLEAIRKMDGVTEQSGLLFLSE
jgi:hypothetical protein